MCAGRLGRRIRTILSIRLEPGIDTVLAFATAVAFSSIYFFGTHTDSALASFLVFAVLGTGIVCVLLPAFYVLAVRGEGLAALGVTGRRWRLALAISAFLAAGSFPELLRAARGSNADLAPHLLVNVLSLWEPFFVFGWLQLRFERVFGVLPGVFLAALSFGAYHLGTFPPPAALSLVGFGLLCAALFRAVDASLLVLWPFAWAVGGGIGTLQGGFAFGWASVPGAAALLLVQAGAIVMFARRSSRRARQVGAVRGCR